MTDADWSREFDRKSVSGTCMRVCTVHEIQHGMETGRWPEFNFLNCRSKKQADMVADSTVSAETAAGCVGVCDVMWQRNVLEELDILANNSTAITLFDNSTLVVNLHNHKITSSARHYASNIGFLCHPIDTEIITPRWIEGSRNWSNQFTKSLAPGPTVTKALHLMGFAEWPEP